MNDPTPSEQRATSESLGDLIGEVTQDLSSLMRKELTLAKAELRESATNAGKGAGMLGAAGYGAAMAIFFFSFALWAALIPVMGGGWSGVVVGALWAVIALILFVVGRGHLKKVKGAPQTLKTMQEFPEAFKRNEENK